MKKIFTAALLGLLTLASCQSGSKRITINGTVTGLKNDTLYVNYTSVTDLNGENLRTDTIVSQQGKFTYHVESDTVPMRFSFLNLTGKNMMQAVSNQIEVLALPGQTLTVKGSMGDYVVEGSEFHLAYDSLRKVLKPYNDKVMESFSSIMELYASGNMPDTIPAFSMELSESAKKANDIMLDYVRQHRDEDLSVYLLFGLKRLELLDSLGEKARIGALAPMYRAMKQSVEDRKAREEANRKIKEGMEAPDFTLKDLQGKDLSLSSLRGKYVVLDFWGSWCGWCIKGFPDMKKYYTKYKDRMEILGIDCNDTEEKWKDAVERNGLPWLHVRNAGGEDVTILYGIQGYPTKIVVDPEGKIIKIVVGEDPAFYQYLDELFNK